MCPFFLRIFSQFVLLRQRFARLDGLADPEKRQTHGVPAAQNLAPTGGDTAVQARNGASGVRIVFAFAMPYQIDTLGEHFAFAVSGGYRQTRQAHDGTSDRDQPPQLIERSFPFHIETPFLCDLLEHRCGEDPYFMVGSPPNRMP